MWYFLQKQAEHPSSTTTDLSHVLRAKYLNMLWNKDLDGEFGLLGWCFSLKQQNRTWKMLNMDHSLNATEISIWWQNHTMIYLFSSLQQLSFYRICVRKHWVCLVYICIDLLISFLFIISVWLFCCQICLDKQHSTS